MEYQIGIVGAGFAGLVAALQLKKSGRNSFVIFERAAELGGTWRDNTYPGCACDVASSLYSFADEPNFHWSCLYSGQQEILQYMKDVVRRNGLQNHIRYNTAITRAQFRTETGCWVVTDAAGNNYTVGVLILGMGPLNRACIPAFPGLASYGGKIFHSSAWDHNYDLAGKRVAVVGTGASAIQIIPAIAPTVSELTVFQRTPPWVSPRLDKPISAAHQSNRKKFPFLLRWQREKIYWINEFLGFGFTGNQLVNRVMQKMVARLLTKQVKDPGLRKKLTPGYKIGCKRILKSDDYYPVFNQPHVQLVTHPIERFVPEGIVAGGNTYPADAVVLATGFVAADIEVPVAIMGPDRQDLIEKWKATGAEAYMGTTVAGYPNLVFLLGPNTGLGHNSVLHMIESQMHYVMQYIGYLERAGAGSYLDVKPGVQKSYNDALQQQLKGTVWNSGCKSWYVNRAGKNTTLFPRLTVAFRKLTRKFDVSVYHLVRQKQEQPAPVQ